MANCSIANGTVRILKAEGCTIQDIWTALRSCGGNYYGVNDYEGDDSESSQPFYGTGRWAMFLSTENMFQHMYEWADNKDTLKPLEKATWEVEFEYADEEMAGCVLYKRKERFCHKAGEPLTEILREIDYHQDYAVDLYHQVVVMEYPLEDVLEIIGIEGDPEYDIGTLEEKIKEVEAVKEDDPLYSKQTKDALLKILKDEYAKHQKEEANEVNSGTGA